MAASKGHKGHFTYCLRQDKLDAYVELSWAPVRKDVRIISKHRTYEEALDAQSKWYLDIGYETVRREEDEDVQVSQEWKNSYGRHVNE